MNLGSPVAQDYTAAQRAELAFAPWSWNDLITYPTLCALHYQYDFAFCRLKLNTVYYSSSLHILGFIQILNKLSTPLGDRIADRPSS
ncbi:MAG: hypothetical protein F6K23_27325 [Okeania sp. SIO2C9]|uniref:hypothetical protein n=1 Tax=Okeania sp. SIO2C9 TaxID=2607791 RepID=UPI0013C167E7|nr:hypothetical protein [Okeania sp. SIO2C9]NEQ76424.1 hypothetical protein [Okeania sp. SIO2C9]